MKARTSKSFSACQKKGVQICAPLYFCAELTQEQPSAGFEAARIAMGAHSPVTWMKRVPPLASAARRHVVAQQQIIEYHRWIHVVLRPCPGRFPMDFHNSFGAGAVLMAVLLLGISGSAKAQQPHSDNETYYVANTRPPDAFLALRTNPTTASGQRILAMPNGTPLKVLERRGNAWWYVRVLPSGPEGWALSRQGSSIWIECCRTAAGGIKPEPTLPSRLASRPHRAISTV
jgi:hypothetical protein